MDFLYFPSFQASTVKDKGLGCPSSEPPLLAPSVSENSCACQAEHGAEEQKEEWQKKNKEGEKEEQKKRWKNIRMRRWKCSKKRIKDHKIGKT
jgi:hypothetical protein